MIDLSRCTTVKSADLKAHKKHSFEISTPETTYLLYAGKNYIMFILISRSCAFLLMFKTSAKMDHYIPQTMKNLKMTGSDL
jgi:hypothetical protein